MCQAQIKIETVSNLQPCARLNPGPRVAAVPVPQVGGVVSVPPAALIVPFNDVSSGVTGRQDTTTQHTIIITVYPESRSLYTTII